MSSKGAGAASVSDAVLSFAVYKILHKACAGGRLIALPATVAAGCSTASSTDSALRNIRTDLGATDRAASLRAGLALLYRSSSLRSSDARSLLRQIDFFSARFPAAQGGMGIGLPSFAGSIISSDGKSRSTIFA